VRCEFSYRSIVRTGWLVAHGSEVDQQHPVVAGTGGELADREVATVR